MTCAAELRPKRQGVALNMHTIYTSHMIFTHVPVNNAQWSTMEVFPEITGI